MGRGTQQLQIIKIIPDSYDTWWKMPVHHFSPNTFRQPISLKWLHLLFIRVFFHRESEVSQTKGRWCTGDAKGAHGGSMRPLGGIEPGGCWGGFKSTRDKSASLPRGWNSVAEHCLLLYRQPPLIEFPGVFVIKCNCVQELCGHQLTTPEKRVVDLISIQPAEGC